MTQRAAAVLAEALRLDEHSRAELAAALLASLGGPSEPPSDASWAAELEHRGASIEAGEAPLEPWEDVRRRIQARRRRSLSREVRLDVLPAATEMGLPTWRA